MIPQTQIFESLKVKLGASRMISDRTINETLEKLMSFVTEETELATFVDLVAPTFTSIDGNLRHEVAEKAKAIEDAKKAATKTPEQIAAEAAAEAAKAGEPEWFKAYRESSEKALTDLQKKFDGVETAKSVEQKKSLIIETAKSKYTGSVVEIAGEYFDFGAETAQADFEARCVNIGNKIGVKPLTGEPLPTDPKAQFLAQKAELIKEGTIVVPPVN